MHIIVRYVCMDWILSFLGDVTARGLIASFRLFRRRSKVNSIDVQRFHLAFHTHGVVVTSLIFVFRFRFCVCCIEEEAFVLPRRFEIG